MMYKFVRLGVQAPSVVLVESSGNERFYFTVKQSDPGCKYNREPPLWGTIVFYLFHDLCEVVRFRN